MRGRLRLVCLLMKIYATHYSIWVLSWVTDAA